MKKFKIPKSDQETVMCAFWFMLRECEDRAFEEKDNTLKHFVEGHYAIWNRLTGGNLKPRWNRND